MLKGHPANFGAEGFGAGRGGHHHKNKGGGAFRHRRPNSNEVRVTYFRLFDTLLNVVFSLLPMPCMAPIAATAIRAAMRPYSMAVAPSSLRISLINLLMV